MFCFCPVQVPRKGRKIIIPVVGNDAVIIDTLGATHPEHYYIYSDDGEMRRKVKRTGPKLTIGKCSIFI